MLAKLDPVHNAGYQAGHHDMCLRGTRESVLDKIMRWSKDPREIPVFWLNGLAGTGKSTIAQTFSEMVSQNRTLGASFFCSRDYLDRKELKNIFPTLAYQLACRYPSFRTQIIQAIREDPSVARNSLISQLKKLVVDPLSSTGISCVIIVDALDECVDDQPASAILSVLARHVKQLPLVKFFITGRPEPRIRTGFRLPLLEPLTEVFLLHEVELSSVNEDIRLYLQEKLGGIAKRRSDLDLSDSWPSDEDLASLTTKSSGLFIFASTLVRFIESEYHEPTERLRLILTPLDSTIHEGRAGVDPLYTQVLIHAFSGVKEKGEFADLRRVLGAVILAFNPLSRAQISETLGIKTSLIAATLRHLHSVLLVPTDVSKEIRIFHKSFPDFMQDRDRCSDSKFFIDSVTHHGDMALSCLELLKKLKPNPCDLPDFAMNREAVNLPGLLEDKVGGALRYACEYWAMHVRSSPTTEEYATRLVTSATEFFGNNSLSWIEVMSLENRLESVIHNINNLLDWIRKVRTQLRSIQKAGSFINRKWVKVSTSDLHKLAQDGLRFTMYFFHPIQQSARHIYHSALPLSPESATFYPMPSQEKTIVNSFYGRPDTWGAVIRTIKSSSGPFTCMTTFSHWIAAASDDGIVGVYDSVTGAPRLILNPQNPVRTIRGSPDGSLLFCAHENPSITLWDIQTGGLVHTFVLKSKPETIAISSTGRYLACGLPNGSVKTWKVANRKERAAVERGSPVVDLCWVEPEQLFAVAREKSLDILDAVVGKVVRRFSVQHPIRGVAYSQALNRLAFLTTSGVGSAITTIRPTTGEFSTCWSQQPISCLAPSRAAKVFVCGTVAPGRTAFNPLLQDWEQFSHSVAITSISTLPNGTVVANTAGSGIQLLGQDHGLPEGPTTSVDTFDEDRIIAAFSITRRNTLLLGQVNMQQVFTLPWTIDGTPTNCPTILCASLLDVRFLDRVVVYSAEVRGKWNLELRRLRWGGHSVPEWTRGVDGQPLAGEISPGRDQIITFCNTRNSAHILLLSTKTGTPMALLDASDLSPPTRPLEIKFESNDRFYLLHDTYRTSYDITAPLVSSSSFRNSITCRGQLPLVERPQRHYDLDDACEWVVRSSKRVCWIPPGYIRSTEGGYCWARNALVMVGQDGMLRKLTFRELS